MTATAKKKVILLPRYHHSYCLVFFFLLPFKAFIFYLLHTVERVWRSEDSVQLILSFVRVGSGAHTHVVRCVQQALYFLSSLCLFSFLLCVFSFRQQQNIIYF